MASNIFMLSYTVSRKEVRPWYADEAKHFADQVRNNIPKLKQEWDTHGDVETTLTGTMDLFVYTNKVSAAKTIISKEISSLLDAVPSQYKPEVSCVLLVNGINELIEFKL